MDAASSLKGRKKMRIEAALINLKQTSFPDRPQSSWVVDAVEPED